MGQTGYRLSDRRALNYIYMHELLVTTHKNPIELTLGFHLLRQSLQQGTQHLWTDLGWSNPGSTTQYPKTLLPKRTQIHRRHPTQSVKSVISYSKDIWSGFGTYNSASGILGGVRRYVWLIRANPRV